MLNLILVFGKKPLETLQANTSVTIVKTLETVRTVEGGYIHRTVVDAEGYSHEQIADLIGNDTYCGVFDMRMAKTIESEDDMPF